MVAQTGQGALMGAQGAAGVIGREARLGDLEKVIRDYDDRLIREARRLVYLYDRGEAWPKLDKEVGYMDTLQAHRRLCLSEYHRLGGRVANAHNFGAHVEVADP